MRACIGDAARTNEEKMACLHRAKAAVARFDGKQADEIEEADFLQALKDSAQQEYARTVQSCETTLTLSANGNASRSGCHNQGKAAMATILGKPVEQLTDDEVLFAQLYAQEELGVTGMGVVHTAHSADAARWFLSPALAVVATAALGFV